MKPTLLLYCMGFPILLSAAPSVHAQEKAATKPPARNAATEKPRSSEDAEPIPPVQTGAEFETAADGVIVKKVSPGSAADEAGLQPGDLVMRVGGGQVLTPIAIDRRFHKYQAGTKVEVVVLRKGREVKAQLQLPKSHEPVLLEAVGAAPSKVTVIEPKPSTSVVQAPDYGWELQERDGKVFINQVAEQGFAARAGLRKGDVILRADRTAITSSKVLNGYLGTLTSNQRSVFAVARGTKTVDVEVVMPATATAVGFGPTATVTDVDSELLARLKVQEELLVKALAELQALRAELKARQ